MTIEQEDTIDHPFVLRQFLHNTASRRISQDGRSQKFHLGELGLICCEDNNNGYFKVLFLQRAHSPFI